jgi:hypothetical protein
MKLIKFLLAALFVVCTGVIAWGCPPAASYQQAACYAPAATYATTYQTYAAPTIVAYPVALQYVVPTVTVPAQPAVQPAAPVPVPAVPQQQVPMQQVPQQEVPQVQAAPVYATPAPVVVRQVQQYYAAPVALAPSYGYAQASVAHGVGYAAAVQRNVVVQRQVVAKAPVVVVRQRAVQRQGILGRLVQRLQARRTGGGAAVGGAVRTTVIVR